MTIISISPKELLEKLHNNELTFLLDVRAEEKYQGFHIENPSIESSNIPKNIILGIEEEGEEALLSLPKDREIVITCTTGNSARKCATILAQKEYNVILLEGGITAWKEYLRSL